MSRLLAMLAGLLLAVLPIRAQADFTLPNGLRVHLVQDLQRPYLELRLEVAWPRGEEPAGREGAATLLARMLEAGGAGPYDPEARLRLGEERGIASTFQAGPGRFRWILRCASNRQDEAFALLVHLAARPALSGPLLEAQRTRLWRERQSLSPMEWVEQRFRWSQLEEWPEGLPSERSLSELGLEHLERLRQRLLRPERAVLHLHGDLNLAQARALALLHLGVWGPTATAPLAPLAGAKPAPTAAVLATPLGAPAARMVLVAPAEAGSLELEVLAELLPRWLRAVPEGPEMARGELLRRADGRPCLLLQTEGKPGADPAALLQVLNDWAGRLAARPLHPQELEVARLQRRSRGALRAPSFQCPVDSRTGPPPTTEGLVHLLRAWCAPAQRRILLTGVPNLAADHPALAGLGPVAWVHGKD